MNENIERKYISKIYLIPSVIVIALFIIGTFFYSNIVRYALLENLRENSIEIADRFVKEIEYGITAQKTIENLLEEKIRNTARIVFRNREDLSNDLLKDLAEDLQVDEIHWFNKEGTLVYSTVEGYLGWQTHPAHPLYAILQGEKELMEDIRPDERFGRMLKHGAVRDVDGTFVQVAISAEKVEELKEEFSFQNLILKIGEKENILYASILDKGGSILVFLDKEDISSLLGLSKLDIIPGTIAERETPAHYELLLPLTINNNFDGYLHLVYSKERINYFFIRNLVFINLSGFLFLALSIFLSRKLQEKVIVNPIKNLKNDVGNISIEKNLKYRLPIKDKDPFYNLRRIINELLDKIQGYVENLKEKQEELEFINKELEETLGQLAASEEEIKTQYEELEALWNNNQELRQKYEIAIKSTNSFVWEVDRDLKLNYALIEGIQNYFNIDIDTLDAEKVIRKLIFSEDGEKLIENFLKVNQGLTEEINTQVRILNKGGEIRWYLVKGKKVYDTKGEWKSLNGVMIDITDLKEQEIYIKYLAEHDPLTGIYNRRKLFDVLEEKLLKGEKGWILLLDIDNFKNINNTLGHFYGDNLLKNIADILKIKLRQEELYRIGGDEFIILLEDAIDAKDYCNKILEILKEEIKVEELEYPITASIGIVKYPKDGKNIEELLKKADISMYQGKFSGKSKCMVFDQRMEEKFTEKIKIETMMRNAIRENGFELLYQPIIEVSTGHISHVEALLRLKDMSISPALFIPIAEESDLIIHIGKWVINKVAEDIKSWREKGIKVKVAINISPKQLYDRKFVPYLNNILDVYKIPPQFIEFEITENILLENREENIKLIKKIKDIGYTISLDDFGTGYSSINYLSYIPLDKLKLDKSIKDRFIKLDKVQIIDSIVNIAHGLDLKVVAEGVETEEEYKRFKRAKCDYVQGYYISKPLDKETVENFIIKNRNGGIYNDTNTTY